MLISIENRFGIIKYDELLVFQIISDALKSFEGRLWLLEKSVENTEKGIYISIELNIKIGESMSEAAFFVMEQISRDITECLQLPLYDIEIIYSGTVSKHVISRNIRFNYKEWYCHQKSQK